MNGKDPSIGIFLGPGGFLYFLLVHKERMMMESKTNIRAVLIISINLLTTGFNIEINGYKISCPYDEILGSTVVHKSTFSGKILGTQ